MKTKPDLSGPWKLYVAYEGLPLHLLDGFSSLADAARAIAEAVGITAERLSMTASVDVRQKREKGALARFEYEGKRQRYIIELVE